jgi:hypothetical protein
LTNTNSFRRVTDSELLGRWQSDPSDEAITVKMGSIVQEFFPDGLLLYAARIGQKTVVMDLRYKLDGDWLVTDQPSSPREERSKVAFTEDDRLVVGTDPPVFFIRTPAARLPRPPNIDRD